MFDRIKKAMQRRIVYLKGSRTYPINTRERTARQWFKANGDKTLRLDYDLNDNSMVFDLGGYEGQWASDIFSRYCCRIHVFEPVPEYAENIRLKFRRNAKMTVHAFGLSDATKKAALAVDNDSSSMYKKDKNSREILLVKLEDFLKTNGVGHIDLMKINIEGAEYDLMEHLINAGLIDKIDNIQIQFHDFVPDARERMKKIQRALEITHRLTYQFPFVWENWKLKNDGH